MDSFGLWCASTVNTLSVNRKGFGILRGISIFLKGQGGLSRCLTEGRGGAIFFSPLKGKERINEKTTQQAKAYGDYDWIPPTTIYYSLNTLNVEVLVK